MALTHPTERLHPTLERVATASLVQLGDIRIDDVLLFIDRGLENMPSYLDLFRRWEKQQWAVSDLDFGPDRERWQTSTQHHRELRSPPCSATRRPRAAPRTRDPVPQRP